MSMVRKMLIFVLVILAVFVVGGIGGIVIRDRVIPYLISEFPSLSRSEFLSGLSGNVTVIERTEQLVVREDDSVAAIVSQPSTAVVNLVVSGGPEDGESRTGVLLTNDGVIVSSGDFSVPEGNDMSAIRYHALLHDGTNHEAKMMGVDSLTQLSFFKIDGDSFPAIALANSDDARPGQKLVAIGNAYEEYQNRFSIGVLSHRDKVFNISGTTVASSEKWEGVFEMDIVNAGEYVGGPAVNFRGEMVGLFGSVIFDSAEYSYLLPTNVVRDSFERAIVGTLSERPVLGVYYRTLTRASAIAEGAGSRDRGAAIYSPSGRTGLAVLSGTPAAQAGLRYGDIITSVNGVEIDLDHPLPAAIGAFSRGDRIELSVMRGEELLQIPVQL